MSTSRSYDPIESKKVSLSDDLRALYLTLKVLVVAALLTIPIFLKWLLQLLSPPPLKKVSGQLALVTGGSAGIGKAIAERLAREGCHIAIVNRNLEMGEKVAEEIRSRFKVNVKAFRADVAKREDVKKLKHDVEESMGSVDILVNNAGVLSVENSLLEGDDEEYQSIIDTNLTSYFWVSMCVCWTPVPVHDVNNLFSFQTTRAFLPGMMERRRGHIVSVSSAITRFPVFGAVAYATSKFGNVGFMESLHEDLCFYGYNDCIKTTTAMPSFVRTQKKHSEIVETISNIPSINVDYTGGAIVNAMLKNKRKIILPPEANLLLLVK
jgi:all-trans-retinol dehydrogenase (NAD+)